MKETTDTETENMHEIFMGYESGAIAIFQAHLSRKEDAPFFIESHVLISQQRIITEVRTKHVLSLLPVQS
jgi:hypothetical protein